MTLLVDFLGRRPGPDLEHISWQQWFTQFDDAHSVFHFPVDADNLAFHLCRRCPPDTPRTGVGHETGLTRKPAIVPSEQRPRIAVVFGAGYRRVRCHGGGTSMVA
jgi:hypothetical protein